MRMLDLGGSGLISSEIALGVMRITKLDHQGAVKLLESAHNAGVNFFDNADIYDGGHAEEVFGAALKDASFDRSDVLVQTKVGIVNHRYDFSKEHILEAVDASLARLGTDYVDSLLLHRPDPLMEPDDIAEAFLQLQNSGKVRQFGVSNFNPMQVELLQQAVPQRLIANQLQLSIMHTGMIDFGLHTNMTDPRSVNHDGGILEYNRMAGMAIQAWSPYQYGFFEGVFIDNPKFPELNKLLHELADKYNTNVNAIASAWILRIPGDIQVIAGTTNADRIAQIAEADQAPLTAQEWYDVYFAAGNDLP
ncbi:aldo/keto reductase [Lacticaseibacillus saniviri]